VVLSLLFFTCGWSFYAGGCADHCPCGPCGPCGPCVHLSPCPCAQSEAMQAEYTRCGSPWVTVGHNGCSDMRKTRRCHSSHSTRLRSESGGCCLNSSTSLPPPQPSTCARQFFCQGYGTTVGGDVVDSFMSVSSVTVRRNWGCTWVNMVRGGAAGVLAPPPPLLSSISGACVPHAPPLGQPCPAPVTRFPGVLCPRVHRGR
jgi:hypothetical protein